ncbi:DEKNAAC101421 [Brettanomyces naardenensis]|uniref:DEKNAAC101421 n=1 Tax=Brettanomyces naardenensis TaxID=13370 RepID=A0A448YI01_BRENA|nr:DEKNAAC101421 [Brettanomyces naardenensis]
MNPKTLTRQQKEKIIRRFKEEIIRREKEFDEEAERQTEAISLKLQGRVNKVLRRFWDFKVGTVLDYEREVKCPDDGKIELANVLKELQKVSLPGRDGEKVTSTRKA